MRPSLSIDVETNQPADMFTQMHASFALQRAFITEKTLFDANNPTPPEIRAQLLTARDVLELAHTVGPLNDPVGATWSGWTAATSIRSSSPAGP